MSVYWQDIKCGDIVAGRDSLGCYRTGSVIEISPLHPFSTQIKTATGGRYWLSDASVKSCVFHSPKYFCASRKPKEGRELMLVQRDGEVILMQDGEPLLKFIDGQEGFMVLGGAK